MSVATVCRPTGCRETRTNELVRFIEFVYLNSFFFVLFCFDVVF